MKKTARKVLLILGPCLLVAGITLIIVGATSSMNNFDSNLFWLSFVGAPVTFVGGAMLLISLFLGSMIKMENFQNNLHNDQSTGSDFYDSVKKAIKKEEMKKYCKYCGSKLTENETKCPNCGANRENN